MRVSADISAVHKFDWHCISNTKFQNILLLFNFCNRGGFRTSARGWRRHFVNVKTRQLLTNKIDIVKLLGVLGGSKDGFKLDLTSDYVKAFNLAI